MSWNSGRSRGRGGARESKRRPVVFGRNKDGKGYCINEKNLDTRSVSDHSSLTDVSITNLTAAGIQLDSSLLKRLYREYIQVRKYKLHNVSVEPLMNNFTEWHGNIIGPKDTLYSGGIFHFIIYFNEDHPKYPPTIKMATRIEHPCIINGIIELDMLTPLVKQKNMSLPSNSVDKSRYWFPGYSTLSILLQLEALFYEGTVEVALRNLSDLTEYESSKSKWESGVRFSVEQSFHMSCNSCKHRPRKMWPVVDQSVDSENKVDPHTCISHYLEGVYCYYSLKKYDEAALGIGINITKDARSGAVQKVKCIPILVSLSSFKSSKGREVWGETFMHWMPIYLDKYSPERSLHLAKRSISSIYTGGPNEFQPSMALDFFPRFLTSTCVSFFQANDGSESLLQLKAYCYMHRLFLQFLMDYPELKEKAKNVLTQFIGDPSARHIDVIPNSGILLIYITFTGLTWNDLMQSFVYESLDRNVRNILKHFPELSTIEKNASIDGDRISRSFSGYNITGLRFVMMQLTFNRIFLAPEGSSLDTVIDLYDKYYSLLPSTYEDQLLEQIEPIKAVKSFSEYFKQIGFPHQTEKQLLILLKESIANSLEKHYHGGKAIDVLSPEEFEKQRLGCIRPLDELLSAADMTDDDWHALVDTRFGVSEVPDTYLGVDNPWKHIYLQHNLQELVGKLNENPDFKLLYETLVLSNEMLRHFELVTFSPHNIKSHYFFLSRIVELLPNLSHLTISKGEVALGAKGFKELVKGMTKSAGSLKVLTMKYLGIEESHVSKLAESRLTSDGLETLILEGNNLRSEGAVKLSELMIQHRSLPNLAELNLRCCQITDDGMKALAESFLVKRNLKKLDLSKNNATAIGLAKVLQNLAYNACIEDVNLSDCGRMKGRHEEFVAALAKLFHLTISLRKLNFWKTDVSQCITEENMKMLSKNSTLQFWDLGFVAGGAQEALGIVFSSNVSNLEELDLSKNGLDYNKCRKIYEKAKNNASRIQRLNLLGNENFLNVTVHKQCQLMVELFTVTFANVIFLNISNCNLVSDAAKIISDVLACNTSLYHLDMSMNQIGKHGARFLAAGLLKNTKLRILNLDSNNIRSAGAHYLASVLNQPSCFLQELYLFCNFIDVPGSVAICKALKTNSHLTLIDLGLNKLRKKGAAAVIDMLSVNKVLRCLCLKFNYIPDIWAIQLLKQLVLQKNCVVDQIKLAGNSLKYETLVTISNLLKEAHRTIQFDLELRAQYLHPDRMERTVYVSPISGFVTPDIIKKLFYTKKCGAIVNVTIGKHKKRKASFAKANYAFIEFAHKDSVELAVDLMRQRDADLGAGVQPRITKAGLDSK